MDNGSAMAFCASENLIYQAEDEGEEDCEVPGVNSEVADDPDRI